MSEDYYRHPPEAIEALRRLRDGTLTPEDEVWLEQWKEGLSEQLIQQWIERAKRDPTPEELQAVQEAQEREDWETYLLQEKLAEYEEGIGGGKTMEVSTLGRLTLKMLDARATGQGTHKLRAGRPKKTEKDSATKVIAALSKWHGYDNGSVTNYEPASNRGLAEWFELSGNALTRFLDNRGGHKKYVTACRDRSIGAMLMLWRGELPPRQPDLQSRD